MTTDIIDNKQAAEQAGFMQYDDADKALLQFSTMTKLKQVSESILNIICSEEYLEYFYIACGYDQTSAKMLIEGLVDNLGVLSDASEYLVAFREGCVEQSEDGLSADECATKAVECSNNNIVIIQNVLQEYVIQPQDNREPATEMFAKNLLKYTKLVTKPVKHILRDDFSSKSVKKFASTLEHLSDEE